MKNFLYPILILLFPLLALSQAVEIEGKLKVSHMDTANTENHLVVKQPDGTLATRMVASLPTTPDTIRTLQSDLILTSALCNCSSLPPDMIQSLLNSGYFIQDLADFHVPIPDLLAAGISIQDLLATSISIQDLLDANTAPLILYNNGVILDSLYGKIYEGGFIFYFDISTGNGYVSATTDLNTGIPNSGAWGCLGEYILGADSTAIGTGSQNTMDIEAQCTELETAADLCANISLNGYNDWFLPSLDELNEMYLKIGQGAPAPNTNIGGFAINDYWSSSEGNSAMAWKQDFSNGAQQKNWKYDVHQVRAIRAF